MIFKLFILAFMVALFVWAIRDNDDNQGNEFINDEPHYT